MSNDPNSPPTAPAPAPAPSPSPAPSNDPMAAFQRLMDRSGSDAAALARQLFDENYRYRDRIRDLERAVPAQGAAVLTPEQAAAWAAYQQLGAPADVQATVTGHAALKRDLEIRDVATASGYALEVLRTLAGDLAFEIKSETKDGKAAQTVYVTPKDGQPTPLESYAATQWAAFLPALKPASGAQGAPTTGITNPAAQRAQQPAQFDLKNPPRLASYDWKK